MVINIDEINKLQAQNKGLIEQNRQLQQDISTLQGKLDAYHMSENEANKIIAELKAENVKFTLDTKKLVAQYSAKLEQLKQTLQEIKEMAKRGFAICDDDLENAIRYTQILNTINKAEEE